MATITSKTKLTFNISYDISSTEYSKLVNLVGGSFVLVPVLNGIDAYTYAKVGSVGTGTFKDCFTWGSSFNSALFSSATPQWDYGTGVASGTNVITYSTDYALYLASDTDLSLSTSIKFGVYNALVNGNTYTPTGDRIDTIDYSDLVNVSCTFTEQA